MNKTYIIAGVVAASLGIAATSAIAFGSRHHGHGGGHGMDISFDTLDSNSDGQITQSEMQAMRTGRFDEADTDGNGVLSVEELTAKAQKRASKQAAGMLERFDKDGDGALSRDEMPKPRRAGRMFDHFDEDGSGGISETEFNEAKARIGERRKGRWGGHGAKD